MNRRFRLAIPVAAVLALCGQALAQPIAEEDFAKILESRQTKWDELAASGSLNAQSVTALNKEILASIDLSALTLDQIRALSENYGFYGIEDLSPVTNRLKEAASEPTVEGLQAGVMALSMGGMPDKDAAIELMAHPAMNEFLKTEDAGEVIGMLGYVLRDVEGDDRAAAYAFANAIPTDASRSVVTGLRQIVGGLASGYTPEDEQRHTALLNHAKALTSGLAEAMKDDERMAGYLADTIAFYDGNFAKGLLMNNPMPTIDVLWSSDETITSMDAFRGKVLVVDFWATWCGPCVASFPNVRELQEHYNGYDVAIVGVTSVQGTHYGANGPVDCTDDPDKEFSLMPEFMTEKNMTWPVVFSKQEVFNPDFGVSGIPHVAIIDPSGRVRFNGLHPAMPMEEKTAKIDSLLQEAGLRVPVSEPAATEEAGG
ncbi:MAG: TlpA family protein disulfide reductase [Phycisphaeraceae bacterium]|nr:TlpA family protein disulfide reductase [Phycisphaeraceae bacterium]